MINKHNLGRALKSIASEAGVKAKIVRFQYASQNKEASKPRYNADFETFVSLI